ncbi:condensation domain-containing protein, partial [Streptomyces tendae]
METFADAFSPRPDTVPALLAIGVAVSPDDPAVRCDDIVLSYAELDAEANRLARLLIRRGVRPESTVAVVADRSVHTVVALLAVLKAGGAYLPADSSAPVGELRDLLARSTPIVTLTLTSALSRFEPESGSWTAIDDPALQAFDGRPLSADELAAPLHPDHPAYVMPSQDFHSQGATTRTHRELVDLLERALVAKDPVLDVLRPLATGGTVELAGPARTEARLPLSFAQRRLWFLHKLQGSGDTSYHVPMVFKLSGRLDVDALRAAMHDVVSRHESLRTIFPDIEGEPYQHVVDAGQILTVRRVASDDVDDEVSRAARHPFDLVREFPFRAVLLEITRTGQSDRWILVAVAHHIAADGWSLGPLWRDVSVAYAARAVGQEPQWRLLPIQYADYALRQHELLGASTSVTEAQVAYWRRQLSNLPQELSLPIDRSRPAHPDHPRAGRVQFAVPADLHAALARLKARIGVTSFMLWHAATALLLSRLGAGTDIPIGSPVAGRDDPALDELVGFFVNTVVIRTDLTGDPRFTDLLIRVRETILEALDNQDVPFERLVEELAPPRIPGRNPLFQVMLSAQDTTPADLRMPDMTVEAVLNTFDTAKFDLEIQFTESFDERGSPAGVACDILYAADLFDHSTVEAYAGYLNVLLYAITADPTARLHRIGVLGAADVDRVVREWNATDRVVPEATVPGLFAEQVRLRPDAVAVVHGDVSVTYAQLDAASNRIARYLQSQGVGPETVVAVVMDRSVGLVT